VSRQQVQGCASNTALQAKKEAATAMSTKRARGSSVVSQRLRKSRKKQCEEGSACPYKHEYQHQLEFAHDGTSSTTTTASRTPNSSPGG
ncbi:unnamed protein product, partial [Ectocarpus sp. 13 AM-2016]